MTLLAAILALVIEQFRPLPIQRWVNEPLKHFFGFLDRQFNDGKYQHGIVAWVVGVALPTVLVAVAYMMLARNYPLLAVAFTVFVLYLTMGFRQFSHHFTDIQAALRAGEIGRARNLLAEWRGITNDRLSSNEVARLALEQALLASHRHVLAPLICVAFLGPAGAVLYRLALFAQTYWKEYADDSANTAPRFGQFSQRAQYVIDWLPVRISATGFAVTGDFEDAIFCWRTQASGWKEPESGILLASGAGALGVRLGLPIHDGIYEGTGHEGTGQGGLGVQDRPELGLGDDADADFMQSAIGLVWRTLLLCLLVMALMWVASWVG